MSESPLISVIVPVYNVEKYLRKCLDSICGQTYRNLEILCVNDGSTDGSPAILEEYAARDSRIKVFTQANAGLAAARNTGLAHATGEWITGVDSDDYIDCDTFEKVLNEEGLKADVMIFGYQSVWESGAASTREKDFTFEMQGFHTVTKELLFRTPHCFWGKIWRYDFLKQLNGRFPDGLWYEDFYFFWAYIPHARSIYYHPEPLYHYVRRSSSIIGATGQKHEKSYDYYHILDLLFKLRSKLPLPPHMQSTVLCNFLCCYQHAMEHLPETLIKKAKSDFVSLAIQHKLDKQWRMLPLFIRPWPSILNLFISQRPHKLTFTLFGISIVTYSIRDFILTIRFLGIKLSRINFVH